MLTDAVKVFEPNVAASLPKEFFIEHQNETIGYIWYAVGGQIKEVILINENTDGRC